jgi:hypothetical protein
MPGSLDSVGLQLRNMLHQECQSCITGTDIVRPMKGRDQEINLLEQRGNTTTVATDAHWATVLTADDCNDDDSSIYPLFVIDTDSENLALLHISQDIGEDIKIQNNAALCQILVNACVDAMDALGWFGRTYLSGNDDTC